VCLQTPGVVLQVVSLVERFDRPRPALPANDFFRIGPRCAPSLDRPAVLAGLLAVSVSKPGGVSFFPLVFLVSPGGCLGNPMAAGSDPHLRDAWLLVHIVLVLVGYAALLVTAVTSILYLIRERQLKRKRAGGATSPLPPLGTLDSIMSPPSRSVSCHYAGGGRRSTWASIESGTPLDSRSQDRSSRWPPGRSICWSFLCACPAGWRGRKAALMVPRAAGLLGPYLGRRTPGAAQSAEPMIFLITGVNHKTAPVEVRERLAFDHTALPAALADLRPAAGVFEGLILSTCNRVEIAVTADDGVDPPPDVGRSSRDSRKEPLEAIAHTSTISPATRPFITCSAWPPAWIPWSWASRRSWVSSKTAYAVAKSRGALSAACSRLFLTRAFLESPSACARKPALARAPSRWAYAAVELAREIFGTLAGKKVMIVGAGKMSELAARHLRRSGASDISSPIAPASAPRTWPGFSRAPLVEYDRFLATLPEMDIVIASSGRAFSSSGKDQMRRVIEARRQPPHVSSSTSRVPRQHSSPRSTNSDNVFVYEHRRPAARRRDQRRASQESAPGRPSRSSRGS